MLSMWSKSALFLSSSSNAASNSATKLWTLRSSSLLLDSASVLSPSSTMGFLIAVLTSVTGIRLRLRPTRKQQVNIKPVQRDQVQTTIQTQGYFF
jgi:hypothetical protein